MARADRKGNRKKRNDRNLRVPDLGYYIIATDTKETEANYLEGFRKSLPSNLQNRIVIKVIRAKTEDLVTTCLDEVAKDPQYREPWIVFDRDQVPHFDEIIGEAEAKGIKPGWSNPCIEIWFDAYFGQMHSYDTSVSCCAGFSNTFEKKTSQEYKKANKQIYGILTDYGDEKKAIQIAEKRLQQYGDSGVEKPSEMCPCTTLQHLIAEIRRKMSNSDT